MYLLSNGMMSWFETLVTRFAEESHSYSTLLQQLLQYLIHWLVDGLHNLVISVFCIWVSTIMYQGRGRVLRAWMGRLTYCQYYQLHLFLLACLRALARWVQVIFLKNVIAVQQLEQERMKFLWSLSGTKPWKPWCNISAIKTNWGYLDNLVQTMELVGSSKECADIFANIKHNCIIRKIEWIRSFDFAMLS